MLPQANVERLQRLLIVLGGPGKLRVKINKVRSVSLPEIRPPFDLDRRRPELVFGLLIALVQRISDFRIKLDFVGGKREYPELSLLLWCLSVPEALKTGPISGEVRRRR